MSTGSGEAHPRVPKQVNFVVSQWREQERFRNMNLQH